MANLAEVLMGINEGLANNNLGAADVQLIIEHLQKWQTNNSWIEPLDSAPPKDDILQHCYNQLGSLKHKLAVHQNLRVDANRSNIVYDQSIMLTEPRPEEVEKINNLQQQLDSLATTITSLMDFAQTVIRRKVVEARIAEIEQGLPQLQQQFAVMQKQIAIAMIKEVPPQEWAETLTRLDSQKAKVVAETLRTANANV